MKMNTLEKIRNALKNLKPEVQLPPALRMKAQISLDRMMSITSNQKVTWPDRFVYSQT